MDKDDIKQRNNQKTHDKRASEIYSSGGRNMLTGQLLVLHPTHMVIIEEFAKRKSLLNESHKKYHLVQVCHKPCSAHSKYTEERFLFFFPSPPEVVFVWK